MSIVLRGIGLTKKEVQEAKQQDLSDKAMENIQDENIKLFRKFPILISTVEDWETLEDEDKVKLLLVLCQKHNLECTITDCIRYVSFVPQSKRG